MTRKEFKEHVRQELRYNTDDEDIEIKIHRPWVYVSFLTHFDDGRYHKDIRAWGVAKICWPDKWDQEVGVDLAIERALAWATKKIMKDLADG